MQHSQNGVIGTLLQCHISQACFVSDQFCICSAVADNWLKVTFVLYVQLRNSKSISLASVKFELRGAQLMAVSKLLRLVAMVTAMLYADWLPVFTARLSRDIGYAYSYIALTVSSYLLHLH